jgi:hypothetical protein
MLFESLHELAAEMLVAASEPCGIFGGMEAMELLLCCLKLPKEMLKGAAEFVSFGHEEMLSHQEGHSCMVSPTMSRRSIAGIALVSETTERRPSS